MVEPPLEVLYDADCGFCRWSVATLIRLSRPGSLHPVAIQSELGGRLLEGTPEDLQLASAHAIGPDGEVLSGGAAAPRIAARLRGGRLLAPLAGASPPLTAAAYRFVANHRVGIGQLVPGGSRRRADQLLDSLAD